jgi:hypothetical protein
VAIAEMVANGGAAMGLYANFTEPKARQEFVRYFNFLRERDDVFHANRPCAELVLLYPRSRVHEGDVAAVDAFKRLGRKLLDEHILFDVLPDDIATKERLQAYAKVMKATDAFEPLPAKNFSRFEAPFTVRISASKPRKGNEITLHFVNYNRKEPKGKANAGRGYVDDNPIAAEGVKVDFQVPAGRRVVRVEALTPEEPMPLALKTEIQAGRLRFTMPRFLVYGIARVRTEPVK